MSELGSWESYFYPETIDPHTRQGTLRNLFGVRDAEELKRLEYVEVAGRTVQLQIGEESICKTFDANHLRAIHRHLFQDVYEWAGEFRTVEIYKGPGREFGNINDGEMLRYLSDVTKLVRSQDWLALKRDDFVEAIAKVFAYLNQAHPFREGNGRTSKLFMQDVSALSPFHFDFALVSPEIWAQASALSRPDLFGYEPEPASLIPVFEAITLPR
ncbi:Fic/DOC family protein [Corynebacterium ulceribovis]|uniref:Fic/DOC family protein n=1 Tax=Corynebacterium ulceribovis TaxID=487732 RepID=UPI000372D3F0|nr:Fic family protein [Corynebacterium ulceribovis]